MAVVKYRYLKVNDGVATSASVQLEIIPNNLEDSRILIDADRIGFRSQGVMEGGHVNWVKSAYEALEIAVQKVKISPKLDITIIKLEGREFIDTNNASIGIASILAFWQYLELKPKDEMTIKMHQFVHEDWKNEVSVIPDFKVLFDIN